MSISLKVQNANEIAEAMANALGGSFVKQASGSALEAYKMDLNLVQDENGLKEVWDKYMDDLNQEESVDEALKLQAGKATELGLPGYSSPADDEECSVCDEKLKTLEPNEEMAWDAQTLVAAKFTINNLVKIADMLDNRGFKNIANIIDETLEKLAKGKGKGKEEKPGSIFKAPKEWCNEQAEKIKKKNPEYSKKKVNEAVGDIWDQLNDKKRVQVCNRYGKTKNPK